MLLEATLAGICLAVLLWATHTVATVAMSLFTMSGDDEDDDTRTAGLQGLLVDAFARTPQDVLLATDLFKSLALLAETTVVVWGVPRWSARVGVPWPPALLITLILVWVLHILAAEVLPKTASADESESPRNYGITVLAAVWVIMRPLVALARFITHRRPITARSAEEREEIVERALESLAESTGMHEPLIEEDEREMIQGVIGLENTEVRELMVPRINIIALDVNAPVEDVRRLTTEWGHSRLPICDGDLDSIIGILYVKDLFCAPREGNISLASLARRAFVVPETKKVGALLEEFKRRKTHIAIVADEFGGTAGLISLEDILEEIVGEIEDEHDRGRSQIEQLGDGLIRVDGVVPLREIAEALEMDLPEQKFETIGGLIYDKVGGVPEVGRTISDSGLNLTIEEMDGQRIRRVRVSRVMTPAPRRD